jgi:hypothetical protein
MLSISGVAVMEHRLIMSRLLGRPLLRQEVVHHIDHNRANNTPENLVLTSSHDHAALHARLFRNSTHKECGKCHAIKSRVLFFSEYHRHDPSSRLCKPCQLIQQQQYNPVRNARRREKRAALRERTAG